MYIHTYKRVKGTKHKTKKCIVIQLIRIKVRKIERTLKYGFAPDKAVLKLRK